MNKIKCPVCKGSGNIKQPKNKRIDRKQPVQVLKEAGYSHREISKLLGYKSANSITHILKFNAYQS